MNKIFRIIYEIAYIITCLYIIIFAKLSFIEHLLFMAILLGKASLECNIELFKERNVR